MEIDHHIADLRAELDAAAAAGTPEVVDAAARLARVLDPATRLVLLDALGEAAAEVTLGLAAHAADLSALATVEVRLRGRTPELTVDVAATESVLLSDAGPDAARAAGDVPDESAETGGEPVDGSVSRLTVRVPDALKTQVEAASAASGSSVNAWVTRVLADAVSAAPGAHGRSRTDPPQRRPRSPGGRGPGQRVQGWVR